MATKLDPEKFNNDPAFEEQRNLFDKLFEGAVNRAFEKKKKETPPDEGNFFDSLFGGK